MTNQHDDYDEPTLGFYIFMCLLISQWLQTIIHHPKIVLGTFYSRYCGDILAKLYQLALQY